MTQTERLVKIYQDSRKRLLADIGRRRVYGTSTYYQEELIRQIDRELRRLNVDTAAWAQEAIPAAYARGARLAYQAVSADTRAIAAFGGLNTRAVEIMAQNTQDFLQITNSLVARQAQDVVRRVGVEVTAKKFSEMLTVRETTKLLETRLDEEGFFARVPFRDGRGSMRLDSYAELVARTTTAEATNTGTLNMMGEMGQVLVKMTAHNTTCRVCAPRQGRVYRTVEAEELPEGDPRRQFPHIREGMPRWPTYKTVHPNCFVSGTSVLAKGVMAHTRRNYIGEVVTISVSGGNKLTVTPNHPILTPKGWVKAGALLKGDKVVKYVRKDDFFIGQDPNDIQVPTLIEDVPHALRKAGSVSTYTVEGTPEQFHGDGSYGKVAIVDANSFLRNEREPFGDKKILESQFVNRLKSRCTLFAKRPFSQIFFRPSHTPDRVMSGAYTRNPLLWGQSCHHLLSRFRTSFRRWVTRFRKPVADGHIPNLEVDCNCMLGHTTFVHSDNFLDRERLSITSWFSSDSWPELPEDNSFSFGLFFNPTDANTEDGCNLFNSLSGQVELLDVVHVEFNFFSGHVFNLHTRSGWYLANDIITHNCAHRLLPYIWTQKEADEQQKALGEAEKPFDLDPRGEAERLRYEKAQRENAERLRDRKQWERYKAVLGDDAPKTLSGFRAMKRMDSENYQFMRLDYARQNKLLQHPELALPNAVKTTAADAKFTEYLFNPKNAGGIAKGVAFTRRLGYDSSNWQSLQSKILQAAPKYPATLRQQGEHGRNYEQKVVLWGERGRPANVVLGWQSKGNETWLATALIKEVDTSAH